MNLPNLPNRQTALCEWRPEAPDPRERAVSVGELAGVNCCRVNVQNLAQTTPNTVIVTLCEGQGQLWSNHPQLEIRACSGTMEQQSPCALNVLNERDAFPQNLMNTQAELRFFVSKGRSQHLDSLFRSWKT